MFGLPTREQHAYTRLMKHCCKSLGLSMYLLSTYSVNTVPSISSSVIIAYLESWRKVLGKRKKKHHLNFLITALQSLTGREKEEINEYCYNRGEENCHRNRKIF